MAGRAHGTPMHCCRCNYDWFPRGDELPKRCPECRSVKWNSPSLPIECLRCGHRWNSQKGSPLRCPFCGSKCWNVPPKRNVCMQCGFEWTSFNANRPGKCPECGSRSWDSESKDLRQPAKQALKIDGSTRKKIYDLDRKGASCVQIAMETGVSCSAIMSMLKDRSPT